MVMESIKFFLQGLHSLHVSLQVQETELGNPIANVQCRIKQDLHSCTYHLLEFLERGDCTSLEFGFTEIIVTQYNSSYNA